MRHHRVGAEDQVLHRDLVFQRIAAPVKRALPQPAEIKDGFAKGLAGNGAGVYADAADGALTLDDGDFLAQLGSTYRRLLSGRPTADHDQVIYAVSARLGRTLAYHRLLMCQGCHRIANTKLSPMSREWKQDVREAHVKGGFLPGNSL